MSPTRASRCCAVRNKKDGSGVMLNGFLRTPKDRLYIVANLRNQRGRQQINGQIQSTGGTANRRLIIVPRLSKASQRCEKSPGVSKLLSPGDPRVQASFYPSLDEDGGTAKTTAIFVPISFCKGPTQSVHLLFLIVWVAIRLRKASDGECVGSFAIV